MKEFQILQPPIIWLQCTFMCRFEAHLLTYSMVQSPSWAAKWFAASQEIPRISRDPKVHYRTHEHPPHISILGQPNSVHIRTSHLLEIHPNIIHPSTPRSPQWSLSLRFPHQDPIVNITSDVKLVIYSSTIKMTHGPINIIFFLEQHFLGNLECSDIMLLFLS